ncbi:MAG: Holliday junction resolvase RuvX [Patescibacteria group bacterium]|nr:Holliday junction resolvase RuvX [bacterium]MDZ4226858.1 Holliday junction resolvase RuvX [Patescibacteria group bacterium]
MKYLGIDYGSKRVGVAVSDDAGGLAFPRTQLSNDDELMEKLAGIVEEEKIESIVVGDTRSHGGGENPVTHEAERFTEDLKRLGLPVSLVSEAWSSVEVSRYAPKGSEHDDAAAAAFILQRFLDMGK